MFTGVHILAPRALSSMPESGCVIRTAYRHWVDSGEPVLGIVDDSPWADLGTVSEYHRLNLELASGLFAWEGVEPRDGSLLAPSVEPSANVQNSVVGAGARVGEGVTLQRCVVWPGTTVTESATNAVITPSHRIDVN